MKQAENSSSLDHFAKHLFIAGKIYMERKKAKEDVEAQIQRMRKSIIRMTLTYSDIDRLKEKISNMVDWERRYAKLFKTEDKEKAELKSQVTALEEDLSKERQEKLKIIEENGQRIAQLTQAFENVKSKTNFLLMDRAKRHSRLRALERKINEKIDLHAYFHR